MFLIQCGQPTAYVYESPNFKPLTYLGLDKGVVCSHPQKLVTIYSTMFRDGKGQKLDQGYCPPVFYSENTGHEVHPYNYLQKFLVFVMLAWHQKDSYLQELVSTQNTYGKKKKKLGHKNSNVNAKQTFNKKSV